MDPRTPVLVGSAAIGQREEDPARAREPIELMGDAILAAAKQARCPDLLPRVQWLATPRGFWDYEDPGRALATRIGAPGARSLVAEIGVLQTTLFGAAGRAIADGAADVCVIAGGEAKYRTLRAQITGTEAPLTAAPGEPDEVWRPAEDIIHPLELQHGLGLPVKQYAMIENALRIAEGQGLDAHRREVAELGEAMSAVASTNPYAWDREPHSADEIREPRGRNRMLAFPYTKLHNSQWNVDQAAALILCAAETADALGIAPEGRVVLRAVADSNFMLPLVQRAEVHRSAGFAEAGAAALRSAGLSADEIGHRELYSCFPSAVRVQQRELGVPASAAVTVTGGMAFAGGPLNNFVLQAAVRLAERVRFEPGSVGMLNAVSGILTKQGVSLWSTEPGPPFAFTDVTGRADAGTKRATVALDAKGPASVVSYTVEFDAEGPERTIILAELPNGDRTLASSPDRTLAQAFTTEDFGGRTITLSPDGGFTAG